MKIAATFLLVFSAAVAIEGRRQLLSEKWRPARARDMSKYTMLQPHMPKIDSSIPWDMYMYNMHKDSKKYQKTLRPTTTYELKDSCGRLDDGEKIVGGQEADPHSWPWQVAIFIDNMFFCGGTLLTPEHVLTAAHCTDGRSKFEVTVGAHNLHAIHEDGRKEITSYEAVVHENWRPLFTKNDVSIIHLPEPVKLSDTVKVICLPDEEPNVGDEVTATGWGLDSDSANQISQVLNQVDVEVISNKECNDIYSIVGDGVVCISTAGGKGTCSGDSGGPLHKNNNGNWEQVGIVSFGSAAGCEQELPAGFSRTYYYRDWIEQNSGRKN